MPLCIAIKEKDYKIVRKLVELGASVDLKHKGVCAADLLTDFDNDFKEFVLKHEDMGLSKLYLGK